MLSFNSIQFEVWKNCPNGCQFCFNKGCKTSSSEDKVRICKNIKYILQTKDLTQYERIGLIGGELFDPAVFDYEVLKAFQDLLTFIKRMMVKNTMLKFFITSGLMFKETVLMEKFLDIFSEVGERVYVCTSYDTAGRFTNQEKLINFSTNMLMLREYRLNHNMNIHIEILPTQHFINEVLENQFDPRDLEERYGCKVDYSDLNSGFYWEDKYAMQMEVPYFFPKRADFIKFLKKVYTEGIATPKEICNYDVFFNELYRLDDDNQLQLILRHGHDKQLPYGDVMKSDYIDSDKLMYGDVQEVWKQIKGDGQWITPSSIA